MTPADLQNTLMQRISLILKDFPLETSYNDPTKFKVYKQHPPEQDAEDHTDQDEWEKEIYPFVSVKLLGGDKKGNHTTQLEPVLLMIGVRNEEMNGKGFDDAVTAAQAIMNDLNKNPMIDQRYPIQYPMKWTPYEENTFPYFFIGIELTFEMLTITNQGGMNDGNW